MIANDQVSVESPGSPWQRPGWPGCASDAANGIGGLLAMSYGYSTSTGGWARHYHYRADGVGNVTLLTWAYNGHHHVTATDRYDPFGRSLGHTGTLLNALRFNGKPLDARTDLYDYGFRFYEPATQRWLTRDPLGEWGGLNLYGFVGNGPVNGVDPYGLALFGLYDTYEEYLSDVSSVLIAEAQGAAANVNFGLYTRCFASELARQGGLVGDALATVGQFGTGVGSLVKGLTRGAFKEGLDLAHYGHAWQYVWYGTAGWAKGAVGGIGYGTISRGFRGF